MGSPSDEPARLRRHLRRFQAFGGAYRLRPRVGFAIQPGEIEATDPGLPIGRRRRRARSKLLQAGRVASAAAAQGTWQTMTKETSIRINRICARSPAFDLPGGSLLSEWGKRARTASNCGGCLSPF
ncbi:hypothetical protein C725_1629 [Pacificimonas flava]|uniref:Uncharacterized protein n=1 Tax=Pacificimonas flava TaxID=1234595 RepID=M2TMS5_9SPHN|nr:hypothetical protein C725_1629 [Pacificimonas flava]